VTDDGFWHIQAEAYLTGLLLTAALNQRSMSDVASWVLTATSLEWPGSASSSDQCTVRAA
jgi:hypothetical protein